MKYKIIAVLNENHNIFLVQDIDTQKIYVQKILEVYNYDIYQTLSQQNIIGIPAIADFYEEAGRLIVIEHFVSGQTLTERIESSTLDVDTIIRFGIELCQILHQLHSLQPPIVHRDIKPSNIIVTEHNHLVLLDFNAAKHFTNNTTNDTVLLGTQGYAAPEQYGFGSSTPKTDIYALGILLKEMLTSLPSAPSQLEKIINRCIQIDPADRYDKVDDLEMDLLAILHPQVTSKATSKSFLPPGFRTKTPWKMLVAIPAYLMLIWLCSSLTVENVTGTALIIERIFCFLVCLSTIFIAFNYVDIRRMFPLSKHPNLIIRYIGVAILWFVITFSLILCMSIIQEPFLS